MLTSEVDHSAFQWLETEHHWQTQHRGYLIRFQKPNNTQAFDVYAWQDHPVTLDVHMWNLQEDEALAHVFNIGHQARHILGLPQERALAAVTYHYDNVYGYPFIKGIVHPNKHVPNGDTEWSNPWAIIDRAINLLDE